MHQLNTDCTGIVMPDPKVELSQQILFNLVALAFCICAFIASICRTLLHAVLNPWFAGAVSLNGSEVTGRVAHCFASLCPWWSHLPWDMTAELPHSAQGSSAGQPPEKLPGNIHVSGRSAWPLLHAEKYKQTRFPLILRFRVPEAFLSPDRLGTV